MNLTVVMITHQMEVVRDACDQVAVIESGSVVEQGSVSEIFTNPKSEVTKDFLSHISSDNNDDENNQFARWEDNGGKYTLRFIDAGTGKPLISDACKKFDVSINILAAGVQKLPEKKVGTMIIDIDGNTAEVEKTVSFFKENGVLVEEE